jgi:large subunit ribosomal protein L7/L12
MRVVDSNFRVLLVILVIFPSQIFSPNGPKSFSLLSSSSSTRKTSLRINQTTTMSRNSIRFIKLIRSFSTEAIQISKPERIADELLNLNRFERHDFTILWRLKMDLDRYIAPVAGPGPLGPTSSDPTSTDATAADTEKTAFDIKLEKYDAGAKIKIIKEVRSFTDLGLKEAKELVEKFPCVLKKGITKDEAGPIIEKLKELGATVVLE